MANTSISNLAAGAAVSATDVLPNVQTAGVGPVKTTAAQIKTFVLGAGDTLPVANGGTGLTSLTAGRVPYGAGTSAFASSTNLFFDGTNFRLGIGTSSPATTLDVANGSATIRIGLTASSQYGEIGRDTGDGYIKYEAAQASPFRGHKFTVGGSEAMRVHANGNVGIGLTSAPSTKLHVSGSLTIQSGNIVGPSTNNAFTVSADSTATNGGWVQLYSSAHPAPSLVIIGTNSERMRVDANGNVVINTAAIATTATDGFLYVPTCAGAPTGVPTSYTGRVPIVVDSTNSELYVYVGGSWKSTALT
jgi:hypothetical protein